MGYFTTAVGVSDAPRASGASGVFSSSPSSFSSPGSVRAPFACHGVARATATLALLLGTAGTALAQQQAVSEAPAAQLTAQVLPEVHVRGEAQRPDAGTRTVITQDDVEKTGATSMADVVRYQPLVEAPGNVAGATRGASRYDRGGTTGFNIRGVEGNRVGLDVDGIEMPDAVGRAPMSNRAQEGTFGMGRDFIDPDMYSSVEILSGTTNAQRTAGGIGGAVSFRSKSPEDFVSARKPFYAGAKLGYNGASDTWTKGVTAAGLQGDFSALVSYSRRDGHETENHGGAVASFPEDWHTDALLLKGVWRASPQHRLELAADIYRKQNDSVFDAWNQAATAVTGLARQNADTARNTVHADHTWTPTGSALLDQLNTRVFWQTTDMKDVTRTTALASGVVDTDLSRDTTRTAGFSSVADKRWVNHQVKLGLNYSRAENEHPFESTSDSSTRQPFPDTVTQRTGVFLEDTIDFIVGGKRLALVPGLRVDRIDPRIRNVSSFGNTRITAAELEAMYGNAPAHTIVSPSFAVLYDLQPGLTAYAQWKRSGRAPNNGEMFGYWNGGGGNYALLGDRDLKKETSNAFDMGVKGTPTPGVTLAASAFYTRYEDFIAYTRYTRASNPERFTNIQRSLTILYQASNRDEATIYGTELSARLDHGTWAPAARGFYSTWALGWSRGHSKSNFAGDGDVPLDTVQPAKAILGVGWDAPQRAWGLNLVGTFVRGKQAESTNRNAFSNNPGATLTDSTTMLFRVPGYARFDLAGYWRLSPNTRLSAGIYNLGDKRYWAYSNSRSLQPASVQDRQQIALSTAPGRTYAVSLNVDF